MSPLQAFASKDPNGWWDVLEVNIRGPYNFIQCGIFIYTPFVPNAYRLLPSFAVPELLKTKGQVVILGSGASQIRLPNASEYCISKHAMLRVAEFVTIGEYIIFSSSNRIERQILIAFFFRVSQHQGLLHEPRCRQDGHV